MAPMTPTRFKLPALLAAGILALQPVASLACAVPEASAVSAADTDRIGGFLSSRSKGLAEALLSTSADDRAVVSGLFAGGDATMKALPDGNYRCRTIKLGGLLPLTVYGYFNCTVSADGTRIDKTTGSQRFSGSLEPGGDALFYRGALHYGDEQPIDYDADAERNQVGCLYSVAGDGPRRYRLELPSPLFESTHDVIELVPVK